MTSLHIVGVEDIIYRNQALRGTRGRRSLAVPDRLWASAETHDLAQKRK